MNRRELLKSIVATVAITTGLATAKLETITKHFLDAAYPVGHVLRYGADQKGFMDSSPALNAAIAEARATGATVYFPPGKYRLSQQLVFTKDVPIEIEYSTLTLESDKPIFMPQGWVGRLRYNRINFPNYDFNNFNNFVIFMA